MAAGLRCGGSSSSGLQFRDRWHSAWGACCGRQCGSPPGFPGGKWRKRAFASEVGPCSRRSPITCSAGPADLRCMRARMESANGSNSKPANRCRTGTSTGAPEPGRARNAYVREDRIPAHLPTLLLLLPGRTCRPQEAAYSRRCRYRARCAPLRIDRVPAAPDHPHLGSGRGSPEEAPPSDLDHHRESKLTQAKTAPIPEGREERPADRPALAEARYR